MASSSEELLIQGLTGIASGVVGGRARRAELAASSSALARSRGEFEQFNFANPFTGMQNTFEDLTVNQQQAQFLAQQQQQGLAQGLAAAQGSFGGGGIAAATQSLMNQQAINLQKSSASIGQQESANQVLAAKGAAGLQRLEGAAELRIQESEFDKTSTILGMAQARQKAAEEAKLAARQAVIGGVGQLAIGGAGLYTKSLTGVDPIAATSKAGRLGLDVAAARKDILSILKQAGRI